MNLFFVRRSAPVLAGRALTTAHVEDVHQAVQREIAISIFKPLCTNQETNGPQNMTHLIKLMWKRWSVCN